MYVILILDCHFFHYWNPKWHSVGEFHQTFIQIFSGYYCNYNTIKSPTFTKWRFWGIYYPFLLLISDKGSFRPRSYHCLLELVANGISNYITGFIILGISVFQTIRIYSMKKLGSTSEQTTKMRKGIFLVLSVVLAVGMVIGTAISVKKGC